MPTNETEDGAVRQHLNLVANSLLDRASLVQSLMGGSRDIDRDCNYPKGVVPRELYQELYDREPIAARVVEVYPKECWQVQPSVYEDEDSETETAFEAAWAGLVTSVRAEKSYHQDEQGSVLWEYLYRADVLSGIGHYGIILLGIDDGKDLSEPADLVAGSVSDEVTLAPEGTPWTPLPGTPEAGPIGETGPRLGKGSTDASTYTKGARTAGFANGKNRSWSWNQSGGNGGSKKGPKRNLTFLRVFPESMAWIDQFDSNPASPRFGQPVRYTLLFNDPAAQAAGIGLQMITAPVHWTRVIHAADNLASSEVFGVPRMQAVLNRLLDIRKIHGGSAEMYWRGAFPGYSLETLPQLGTEVDIDQEGVKKMMWDWANGLQRHVVLTGLTMKSLSPQVTDPSPQVNTQIEAICIKLGVPVRIFKGSERGELASSQDDAAWNDRLKQRQAGYVTPRLIVPFVDRLIALGVLPAPEGYSVWWPDLTSKSDQEKAAIASQRTTGLVAYGASAPTQDIITPTDYLIKVQGFDEAEAQSVVENAQAEKDKREKEQVKQQADQLKQQQDQAEADHQRQLELAAAKGPQQTPPNVGGGDNSGTGDVLPAGPEGPPGGNSVADAGVQNYHPDQPRDDAGKWTSNGPSSVVPKSLKDQLWAGGNKNEAGALVDARTGEVLHRAKGDTASAVDLGIPGRFDIPVINVHTHPDEGSFSDEDWAQLGWGAVHGMVVVSKDYEYHLNKKNTSIRSYTPRELRETWNDLLAPIEDKADIHSPTYAQDILHQTSIEMSKRFPNINYERRRRDTGEVVNWNPDQPRDKSGEWTAGGGGTGSPPDPHDPKVRKLVSAARRKQQQAVNEGAHAVRYYDEALATLPPGHDELRTRIHQLQVWARTERWPGAVEEARQVINLGYRLGVPSKTFDKLSAAMGAFVKARDAARQAEEYLRKAYKLRRRSRQAGGSPPPSLPNATQNYDPDQPREPAGTPGGGQFTRDTDTAGKGGDAMSSRLDDSRDLVHSYIRENGPATASDLGHHLVDEGHAPDHGSAMTLVHDLHAAGHLKRSVDDLGLETYDVARPATNQTTPEGDKEPLHNASPGTNDPPTGLETTNGDSSIVLFPPGDLAALEELDLDLGPIGSTPTADDNPAADVAFFDPDLGPIANASGPITASPWSPYRGPRGGIGWKNINTGRIVYGGKQPGLGKGHTPVVPGAAGPGTATPPTGTAPGQPKAQRADPATVKAHIAKLLANPSKITPDHIREVKEQLLSMTVAQIHSVRKDLGLKASGVKADLAAKVAKQALAGSGKAQSQPAAPAPSQHQPATPAQHQPPAPLQHQPPTPLPSQHQPSVLAPPQHQSPTPAPVPPQHQPTAPAVAPAHPSSSPTPSPLHKGSNVITGALAPAHIPVVPHKDEIQWSTGKPQPGTLNGVEFTPAPHHFWEHAKDKDIGEPPPTRPIDRTGVMVQEPDGRIWIAKPTNEFGDRKYTMPGGSVEHGLTHQQNALKEVWEETGLQVEITGHLGDFRDSNTGNIGRMYIGKRVGGAPWDAKVEPHIIDQKTGKPAAESSEVVLATPERARKLLHRSDDLAQLMTVAPIPLSTPTRGRDSEPMEKLVEAIQPKVEAYRQAKKAAGQSPGIADLHAVQELRGFNEKPQVLPKKDMDALIAKGDHIEVLRGLQADAMSHPTKTWTAEKLADDFRYGDHYPGFGVFGAGTYTDGTKGRDNIAFTYASGAGQVAGGGSSTILRIAIPKDAKIVKFSELNSKVPDAPLAFTGKGRSSNESQDWLGLHAALAGYDAIHMDQPGFGHNFYVILNRGVVTVQKEDASGHMIK